MAASQPTRGGSSAKKPAAKKTTVTKWDTSKKKPGPGWGKEYFPGGGYMWVKVGRPKKNGGR